MLCGHAVTALQGPPLFALCRFSDVSVVFIFRASARLRAPMGPMPLSAVAKFGCCINGNSDAGRKDVNIRRETVIHFEIKIYFISDPRMKQDAPQAFCAPLPRTRLFTLVAPRERLGAGLHIIGATFPEMHSPAHPRCPRAEGAEG